MRGETLGQPPPKRGRPGTRATESRAGFKNPHFDAPEHTGDRSRQQDRPIGAWPTIAVARGIICGAKGPRGPFLREARLFLPKARTNAVAQPYGEHKGKYLAKEHPSSQEGEGARVRR
jgi:hypothetical protein